MSRPTPRGKLGVTKVTGSVPETTKTPISTTPSPSNMTGTSIEVWENLTGMLIESKELLMDSGGPGEFRGGLGQRIEFVNDSGSDIAIACLAGRTKFPPRGMRGGRPGGLREIRVNGATVHPKGRYTLAPGDRLTTFEAGGGGFGDPLHRDREALRRDVAQGFVSGKSSADDYGGR